MERHCMEENCLNIMKSKRKKKVVEKKPQFQFRTNWCGPPGIYVEDMLAFKCLTEEDLIKAIDKDEAFVRRLLKGEEIMTKEIADAIGVLFSGIIKKTGEFNYAQAAAIGKAIMTLELKYRIEIKRKERGVMFIRVPKKI